MAIIKGNPWVQGASGMVMNQIVYRQRAGRTIISPKPRKPSVPPSEKQKQHREQFRKASRYARAAARHIETGPMYATQADGFNSAYNIALKDYMSAPSIDGFDTKGFRGRRGDCPGVFAHDNFRVAQLTISFINEAGEVLTSGVAEEVIDNTYFTYRLREDLPAAERLVMRAEARDHAGNVTVYEEPIPWAGAERTGPGGWPSGRVGGGKILRAFTACLLLAAGLLSSGVRQAGGSVLLQDTMMVRPGLPGKIEARLYRSLAVPLSSGTYIPPAPTYVIDRESDVNLLSLVLPISMRLPCRHTLLQTGDDSFFSSDKKIPLYKTMPPVMRNRGNVLYWSRIKIG